MRFFRPSLTLICGPLAAAALVACGNQTPETSETKLRNMTRAEAIQDFRHVVDAFRTHYGPLEFKQERYGFKLDELAASYEEKLAAASSDPEFYGLYKQFLASFEDGHVGISFQDNATGVSRYKIPLFLTPVEGKALVGMVGPAIADTGITVGDEVTLVDGVAPFELLKTIKKYEALGNEASEQHWVFMALMRPFYMTELKPTSPTVKLQLRRADGSDYSAEITWRIETVDDGRPAFVTDPEAGFFVERSRELNAAAESSLLAFAQVKPFFHTPEVVSKFGLVEVKANADYLTKYGVDPAKAPEIYAALYRFEGKTLLIVRQAGYSTENWSDMKTYMRTYKAILDQYEELVDGLVVEQTHNPGGAYCQEFFRLFISEEKNAFVQFDNTDRLWIRELESMWPEILADMIEDTGDEWKRQFALMATELEHDYDAGLPTTKKPQPVLGGWNKVRPFADYSWKKPMLVLVDELAGSCGDLFPMLVKHNGVAKIFGKQPMGLGGNVETVAVLPNSGAELRLTRGLFTTYREDGLYTSDLLIENQGVSPDIEHSHTAADFRAGWVGYVGEFSRAIRGELQ